MKGNFDIPSHVASIAAVIIFFGGFVGWGIWEWSNAAGLLAEQGKQIAKLESDNRYFQNVIQAQHQTINEKDKDIHYLQGRLDGSIDLEDAEQARQALHSMSRVLKTLRRYAKPHGEEIRGE